MMAGRPPHPPPRRKDGLGSRAQIVPRRRPTPARLPTLAREQSSTDAVERTVRRPSEHPTLRAPAGQSTLIVGKGFAMSEALVAALVRHGIHSETASEESLESAVLAAAPDLLILVGDASTDGGKSIVGRLAGSRFTSSVPVVLVTDEVGLEVRLRAFRHGVAAVVPASASVDALAQQLVELSREIPERAGVARGTAGRTTLNDLVNVLGAELKTGILSVTGGDEGAGRELQLVLGEGRPLAALIDDFVTRLQQHVVSAEPLFYEFDERAGGSVQILGPGSTPPMAADTLVAGLPIVLADDDAARADAIAQVLRRHGATVVVTDLASEGPRFERLRLLDPAVLLVGERQLRAGGAELVRRMRDDTRLRWVSLLVVQWDEIWPAGNAEPRADSLLSAINGLIEPDRVLLARARETHSFDTRLEVYGPARLLKALGASPRPLRVTVHNPRAVVTIDLENGLLVGAEARLFEPELATLHGIEAVAVLSVLSSGRVTIESVEHALVANVMDPIEIAVSQAFSEEPPIPASRPSTSYLGSVEAALSLAPPPPSLAPAPAPVLEVDQPEVVPVVAGRRTRRLLVGGGLCALVAFFAIAVGVSRLRTRADATSPTESAAPASVQSAQAVGTRSLVERARAGEVDAMKQIELRPQEQRTVDESLALAAGRASQKRRELEGLRAAIQRDPKLADKPETLRTLRDFAGDASLAPEALRAAAELPGTRGADLLYDVWTGTLGRTETTRLAKELVHSDEVRKKASKALGIALDLRNVGDCEQAKLLLPQAIQHADKRSLRPLARLLKRHGCGSNGSKDCFTCIRQGTELNDAIFAAEQRAPPSD